MSAGAESPAEARLAAGRVGRAHGLDGSFYVTRPRPRLLELGTVVHAGGRRWTIERRSGTEARPIIRLQGVTDRAGADGLRGQELSVPVAAAPRLEDGEWWAHELEGCRVLDGDREIGTVARMLELPSCEALEVLPGAGGAPLLVPMVKAAIRAVSVAERRIDVDTSFLGLDEAPPDPGAPA